MASQQQNGSVRPDKQTGTPFPFDIRVLTVEQRELWDEWFARLHEWTTDDICQVTMLELWSFGYLCMFELGDTPAIPAKLDARLRDYGQKLAIYPRNVKRSR